MFLRFAVIKKKKKRKSLTLSLFLKGQLALEALVLVLSSAAILDGVSDSERTWF